jgi:predicted hydrocarbon binding protein
MPPPDDSTPLPDRLFDGRSFRHDATAGTSHAPDGERIVFASPAFLRAAHEVLQAEHPGVWKNLFHAGGVTAGQRFGATADRELARLGQPALAEQPLDACLAFAERHFADQGWGLLASDLSEAPAHGLVIARLRQSCFIDLPGPADDFADALPEGFLQGFLEHVSGQPLGCLEIDCARHDAPHCTFVITSTERLESVAPLLGRSTPEEIIAQLKS